MKHTLRNLTAIIATSGILYGAPALSAEVKDQIKHREAIMEAIGGHFGAIFATLKGPADMQENFGFHAESIATLSKIAVHVFPAGSGEGKTDAKPDIWEKPAEFEEAMNTFLDRAEALRSVVADGGDVPAIAAAAKKLGGACKGCHDDFKKE